MLSDGLGPHTIHISNFLENSREEKLSKKINDQKSIVTKELEEVILKRDQLIKFVIP